MDQAKRQIAEWDPRPLRYAIAVEAKLVGKLDEHERNERCFAQELECAIERLVDEPIELFGPHEHSCTIVPECRGLPPKLWKWGGVM